ncbi:MAG: TldD/PmbA family protein [Methanobacteriota archaeon]|nr:MAG: TldD/PmbA family protein [Euryarchaeota archaeon]
MLDNGIRLVNKALEMGADDAEACILVRKGLEHKIEKGKVKLATAEDSVGRGLRIMKDHKLGFSFSTDMNNDDALVEKALSLSRLGKEMKEFSLPSKAKLTSVGSTFDKRLADLPLDYGVGCCEEGIRGALDVSEEINVTSGRVRYGSETLYVANSVDLEAEDRVTYFFGEVDSVLKKNGVSNGTEVYWSKQMDADLYEVGKGSAQWAIDTANPEKMEGGKMTVLFHPLPFRSMMEFVLVPALYADRARKGESVYSDRIGEMVADESISVFDDPTMPNGPNSGIMDDEGTPSSRTDLIVKGNLESFLYDSLVASEYSEKSTSNAMKVARLSDIRQFKYPPRVCARNFTLEGPQRPLEDLIAETDDGVLVHGILGAHTSNPASGDFSISSPRLLRIKNGEIKNPVAPVMISGNFPELLKDISGLGDDRRNMKGSMGALGIISPSARFEDVLVIG